MSDDYDGPRTSQSRPTTEFAKESERVWSGLLKQRLLAARRELAAAEGAAKRSPGMTRDGPKPPLGTAPQRPLVAHLPELRAKVDDAAKRRSRHAEYAIDQRKLNKGKWRDMPPR